MVMSSTTRTGLPSSGRAGDHPFGFDPMSGSWPMILLNIAWVMTVTAASGALALRVSEGWSALAAYGAIASIALFLLAALPLRYFLLEQRRAATAREEQLSDESDRRHFESQLVRALEMSDESVDAVAVAVRGLHERMDDAGVEIMLADSSRAHLTRTADATARSTTGACNVETPRGCPAVRAGHALRFDDSNALDACPHLRSRASGCSAALCVPINVMGSTTGVIHLTRSEPVPFVQRDAATASGVAQQLGSRLGLVAAMAQSELQANTDPLTGLLNRRSLENHVRALRNDQVPYAVVLADLDHFKILNDTHGHDAGDRALRVFARVLRTIVGSDDLVCRYGGEEFVLVFPQATSSDASDIVEAIRAELHAATSDGHTPPFTFSAGLTDTSDGDDLALLVTRADQALLRAKTDGRNRSVVANSFNDRSIPEPRSVPVIGMDDFVTNAASGPLSPVASHPSH
jgi:diguanylate cyclase (GGDEF)-like protein